MGKIGRIDPRLLDPRVMTSGDASAGQVPTADGSAGIAWGGGGAGNAAYTEVVGDGTTTVFAISHGLGSQALAVEVWDLSGTDPALIPNDGSVYDVSLDDNNNGTFTFGVAPGTDEARLVLLAAGAGGASHAQARRSSEFTIPAASTFTAIPLNETVRDTDSYHDTGTNPSRLTVPAAGLYRIYGTLATQHVTAATVIAGYWINGVTEASSQERWGRNDRSGGTFTHLHGTDTLELESGDYVELTGFMSGATRTVRTASTFLGIERIG